eukprot:2260362-Rhodomonas_salina.1
MALLTLLETPELADCVIADSNVIVTKPKQRKAEHVSVQIKVPSMPEKHRTGSIKKLWELSPDRLLSAVQAMESPESGREKVAEYTGGLRREIVMPLQTGRIFVTVHRVTYELHWRAHTKLMATTWAHTEPN